MFEDKKSSGLQPISGSIVPIAPTEIKRIVAGQVILDLASSIKELVDNALDSGANSVTSKCNSTA